MTNNSFTILQKCRSFFFKHSSFFDTFFYFFLCLQFSFAFIDTTCLIPSIISSNIVYNLFYILCHLVFLIICLIHILFNTIPNIQSNTYDKYITIYTFLVTCLFFIFNNTNSSEILIFFLALLASAGKSHKKLLKLLIICSVTIMLLAILLSQAGIIKDWIYFPNRHSLGINYCTDCGAHILFIVLAITIYSNYKPSISLLALLFFAFELCYFIVMAKTASICIIILMVGISLEYFFVKHYNKSFLIFFKSLMLLIFPFSYVVFCLLTCMYALFPNHFPNNTFTSRLDITVKCFNLYALSLFGKNIIQHGNGAGEGPISSVKTNNINIDGLQHLLYAIVILLFIFFTLKFLSTKRKNIGIFSAIITSFLIAIPSFISTPDKSEASVNIVSNYFWLDCSYMRIIFCNGILVFIITLIIATYVQWQASKQKNYCFMFIMCIIALDCTIEHHLTDISYNFIFLLALSDHFGHKKLS